MRPIARFLSFASILASIALAPIGTWASSSARTTPCTADAMHVVSKRSHAIIAPCVAKPHRAVLETNYYQNASKVGGTALAAYPEVRLRYGVANHLELFLDGPSEIAKSGLHGSGIYVMAPIGFGGSYEFARVRGVSYSFSAENRPPLQPLANESLVPLSDFHVSANWAGGRRTYGAEIGELDYASVLRHHTHRSSPIAALSLSQQVARNTYFTGELSEQLRVLGGSAPQTAGILSMQHLLSQRVIFSIEGGSSFNAQGDTKPHYWGFGFIYH